MRPAGPGHGLRRRRQPLPGEQARGRGQVYRRAGQDHHDALHPLHALHPLRRRGRRRARARRHRPRRGHGDHHLSRAGDDLGAAGQRGRSLPGRCAHQQALRLRGPAVGAQQDRVNRRDGRGRLSDPHRHPRARGHAHPAARQRRRERGVDFRQDPPRGRRLAHAAPRPALYPGGRPPGAGDLVGRVRRRRRQGQGGARQPHRRHRRRASGGRGDLCTQGSDDAARRRQSRLPAGRRRARSAPGPGELPVQCDDRRHRAGRRAADRRRQSAPGSGGAQRPHPQALAHGQFPDRADRRADRSHLSLRVPRRRRRDIGRRRGRHASVRRQAARQPRGRWSSSA